MKQDDYESISPLYMQKLKNRVEGALWNLFDESKYRQVEEYIRRWHEDDGNFWENFCVYRKDDHIDLSHTLAEMPNDTLVRLAADIGVETPGMLPCIPVMKNILNQNNTNAYMNFTYAVKNVYDRPDQAVALAASSLEGVIKTICKDTDPDSPIKNLSLSRLTNTVVKELIGSCDVDTPQEIKTLATQIKGLGNTIDNLRSDKSTAHGKAAGEYVIDDELWAETVVNATATLGILLWRLYERSRKPKGIKVDAQPLLVCDDEIPF